VCQFGDAGVTAVATGPLRPAWRAISVNNVRDFNAQDYFHVAVCFDVRCSLNGERIIAATLLELVHLLSLPEPAASPSRFRRGGWRRYRLRLRDQAFRPGRHFFVLVGRHTLDA